MKQDQLEEIKKILHPFFRHLGVNKVVLFGSYSRGSETRKSDLDLLIVTNTDKRFFDRYGSFEKIYELIKDRNIDLLIYTPEELDRIAHRSFIKKILTEGKTIYEH
ncbi:conserved hypothetical protein [uncultured Desulfobacterium sp.]|uniref:Polymerase nucleotidyl transferase domain-containing protein n=1 Tax=uncultured Desulfobacterium sp. TaxID=201089 RepID=A0A445MZS7_9BACT|nr:conserved hypothetical protein [uncultured Desulfobacterium sp.]